MPSAAIPAEATEQVGQAVPNSLDSMDSPFEDSTIKENKRAAISSGGEGSLSFNGWRQLMTNRSKLAAIVMLMVVGVAMPAFAGPFNDDQTTAAKLDEVVLRQGSLNASTLVPLLVADSDNSSATGGGSYGYNNSTAHDYI